METAAGMKLQAGTPASTNMRPPWSVTFEDPHTPMSALVFVGPVQYVPALLVNVLSLLAIKYSRACTSVQVLPARGTATPMLPVYFIAVSRQMPFECIQVSAWKPDASVIKRPLEVKVTSEPSGTKIAFEGSVPMT